MFVTFVSEAPASRVPSWCVVLVAANKPRIYRVLQPLQALPCPLYFIYNIIVALSRIALNRIALAQTPAGNWTPLSGHQAEVFLSYLGTQPHRTQPHRTQRIALTTQRRIALSRIPRPRVPPRSATIALAQTPAGN